MLDGSVVDMGPCWTRLNAPGSSVYMSLVGSREHQSIVFT